ncbi:MAG: hypothetical protein CVU11_02710 [Bacteroidetes bacterium HGW-Bacteroidetes-6]|jgi:hypothetical protein|nr:MAG: hypothetical protein CVU11_02710 [Bacteroidetes bacterium HGW-Bacteroidetes-6]
MKHLLVVVSLLTFIFSCSSNNTEEIFFQNKLGIIDKCIYDKSYDVLDSLNSINTSKLSDNNKAYYNLLSAIAINESNGTFKNDSLITFSLTWYEKKKDHYNYCRSILYKGIALFNSNKSDSIAYSYLKQSEELYNKYEYSDKILQSSIYQYLGKMNRIKKNYKEAEQYLLLSCNISTELNRNNDEYNTRLELFWTYLAQKRYKEALSNIIHFEESDMSSPEIQYSLYNALSGYYSAKNELNISIEYVKKMVKLMGNKSLIIDKPKLYYTLSSYYKRIEVQDSAIYYSKLAVLSIVDSLSTENSFYYKYLADIYASKGDYINAYNNYKNAYNSYIYTYSKITKNRVLEIEKKYDTKRLEISLLANRHDKNFFMICCLSLFCFSALMISMLIIKLRIIKKQNSALSMQNVNFKQECKKSRLINELLQISAELLIMYTDALNIQAYKHRKSSNTIFDDLNKLIDNIKSETRRKITIVANSEMILTDNPNLMSLPELSDLEKIVFVLKHYGYSSHDIAKILSTTSPRITAVNAKVKEKISKRT